MKYRLSYNDKLRKLELSQIEEKEIKGSPPDDGPMLCLQERVKWLLNLNDKKRNPANMLFFIMYDISSDRVRNMVAKYLINKGCFRIQKSIFIADLPGECCQEIKMDLKEVQAAYENNDSILVLPIPETHFNSMAIIGKEVDVEMITHKKTVLFF